jgi:hypothetical protein
MWSPSRKDTVPGLPLRIAILRQTSGQAPLTARVVVLDHRTRTAGPLEVVADVVGGHAVQHGLDADPSAAAVVVYMLLLCSVLWAYFSLFHVFMQSNLRNKKSDQKKTPNHPIL